MSISRGRRFRVLARDGFTCRYCGAKAPDVQLQVDHIHPRSRGGSDRPENLITACFDCNMGKNALVMDPVLIALVAPVPFPEVARHVHPRPLRAEQPTDLPWGIGSERPYIARDRRAPEWRCSQCGMWCQADGDVCSCNRPKYYCESCDIRMADAAEGYDGLCEECSASERWRRDDDEDGSAG